jgi:uncharacterized oligopeptide transporter (OPT) family protein
MRAPLFSGRIAMAIEQLSDEQVRTWTLEQKDRWWLERIYRGDMPQLTLRSAVTGFVLGGVLSATNLYIGAKTGWSLGVGITSVILAFAFFQMLRKFELCREFTILENNAMQSIATSAGYMTAPLTSSMAAYMIVDNRLLPWYQLVIWNVLVSILGVLFAFPMKRRFINDEQHPFPEGRAAAVVMDTLHHSEGSVGMKQAVAMLWAAGLAGLIKFLQAEGIQELIQFRWLNLSSWLQGKLVRFPEHLDGLMHAIGLRQIRGIDLHQLTVLPSLDLSLIGAGGLMGIRGGMSLLIGAILNYCVLAPWMIQLGEIKPAAATGNYGLRQIALWALWPGVACMVVASFVSFLSKPKVLLDSVRGLFGPKKETSDVLKHIEVPLWISLVGIPVFSFLSAWFAHRFFGVDMLMCLVGLPLTFLLSLVAANSTALTSITPVGATSKITQLFYGILQPRNIHTNLATASLTAEVVSNASNLLMDIKPGYMLGAKPRQQAIGHLIGIVAGSICSVPLFYILFAQDVQVDAQGVTRGIETLQSDKFPMPSVTVWKAVAEVLTEGVGTLPGSARFAVGVAALVGFALEVTRIVTKGRFALSAVGLGLAFVIDFSSSFAMFLGALFFWLMGVERPVPEGGQGGFWKDNHEAICAGIIAGAALVGIVDALVTAFVL